MATPTFDDNHGVAPGVPDPVNCVVDPSQAENTPVIVGNAFTVNVSTF